MTRLLVIALMAAAVLAGCGSDDNKSSDKSSSQTTSTVPKGHLGAVNSEHCTPPKISGFAIQSLDSQNNTCDDATALLEQYFRDKRLDGYSCQQRYSGR